MGKYINKISLFLLVLVLYSDVSNVFATTRGLYFNTSNQNNSVSDYMGVVPGNANYPIEYFILTGDTSRGAIYIRIYEYSDLTVSASSNLLKEVHCPVGSRIATTGVVGGTETPLFASAGRNYTKLFLNKGAVYSPNSSYSKYIGNAFMSTPLEDVMSYSLLKDVDLEKFKSDLNEQAVQAEAMVSEWDELNEQNQ